MDRGVVQFNALASGYGYEKVESRHRLRARLPRPIRGVFLERFDRDDRCQRNRTLLGESPRADSLQRGQRVFEDLDALGESTSQVLGLDRACILRVFLPFGPERIVQFGSGARGDADEFSDIDIIVVYPTEKRFLERLEELYLAWDLPRAIDILAYTPDEFEAMAAADNPFLSKALEEGEVLYEKC